MSEVSFSPIKINPSATIHPPSDVSKLDPNSPEFFNTLNKVFANETSKLAPIAPGIFVPNPGIYATLNITPSTKPDAPLS